MKKFITDIYRGYKSITKNRTYKIFNYSLVGILSVYALLLIFPQVFFAHDVSYKNFKVYARKPLGENINKVLDSAEARLLKSPIYDGQITERIFITDSPALFTFQSPAGRGAFASTIPGVGNIRVAMVDVNRDLVFRNAEADNQRSLSSVVAHEVTHNLIRKKYGLINSFTSLPNWKDEGYCEYIAGETTISFEEGKKRWKENPADDSKYAYFKYHQMVKYLLDVEKIGVEELFNRNFDRKELEAKVYEYIQNGKS